MTVPHVPHQEKILLNVFAQMAHLIMDSSAMTVIINVILVITTKNVPNVTESEKTPQIVTVQLDIMMPVLTHVNNVRPDVLNVKDITDVQYVLTQVSEVELLVNVQMDTLMILMVLHVLKKLKQKKKMSSQLLFMMLTQLHTSNLTQNLSLPSMKFLLDSIINSCSETQTELNYLFQEKIGSELLVLQKLEIMVLMPTQEIEN